MSSPTYVTKSLVAASSNILGSFSSASVVSLFSSINLDTARRITVAGTSALNNASFTVTGRQIIGGPIISETILTSTATPGTATTTQDFIQVTSFTLSCALTSSGGGIIGTNTQGGTSWQPVNTISNPVHVEFRLGITSASTVTAASFEYTMDYPSYNPNTGLWGGATPTQGPQPIVSSLGSTATSSATVGLLSFPFAAWRITVTSTSSTAGSVVGTVLQSGY